MWLEVLKESKVNELFFTFTPNAQQGLRGEYVTMDGYT